MTTERFASEFAHYRRHGWALFRAAFSAAEVAELQRACDELQALATRYPDGYAEGVLRLPTARDRTGRPYLKQVLWPAYRHPTIERFRTHPTVGAIACGLLGPDLVQLKNQIHWKPAGDAVGAVRWHQDCQFRIPQGAYRDLGAAGCNVLTAVDRAGPDHGPLEIHRASHARGDLCLGEHDQTDLPTLLRAIGLDPAEMQPVLMEPGDVVAFSPFVIHGSGVNRAGGERRAFINGYCRADACEGVGVPAWIDGHAVPLGPQPHPTETDFAGTLVHPHRPGAPEVAVRPLATLA